MMELIGKLPVFVQIVVVIAIIFCTLLSIAYLLLAIQECREDRARERREKQKVYDAVKRISRSCEKIADILATTEVLSTVEITEERTIPYD